MMHGTLTDANILRITHLIHELAHVSHHLINRFSYLPSYLANNRLPYHLRGLTLGHLKATADGLLGDTNVSHVPKGVGWLKNKCSKFNEEKQDSEFPMKPNFHVIDKCFVKNTTNSDESARTAIPKQVIRAAGVPDAPVKNCCYAQLQQSFTDAPGILHKDDANVNVKNNQGWTPLHIAAYYGHVETCAFLLDCGAAIDDKNDFNEASFRKCKMMAMVKILSCAHCFRIVMQTDADKFKVRSTGTELIKDTHGIKM